MNGKVDYTGECGWCIHNLEPITGSICRVCMETEIRTGVAVNWRIKEEFKHEHEAK